MDQLAGGYRTLLPLPSSTTQIWRFSHNLNHDHHPPPLLRPRTLFPCLSSQTPPFYFPNSSQNHTFKTWVTSWDALSPTSNTSNFLPWSARTVRSLPPPQLIPLPPRWSCCCTSLGPSAKNPFLQSCQGLLPHFAQVSTRNATSSIETFPDNHFISSFLLSFSFFLFSFFK